MVGNDVIATHSEENFDTSEMGMVARFDARAQRRARKEQTKWSVHGLQIGFATPVMDEAERALHRGQRRDRAAPSISKTGKTLWEQEARHAAEGLAGAR